MLSATERNAPLQGYDSKVYRKSQRGRHKEKAALFLTSAGIQFPLEEQTNSFLSYKIAEEEEFVNTKKHRSSQAHYLRARCGACARRCFNYVALYQKLFLRAIISCLEHIQVKHKDMSEEILKKIPAAMAESMMIFKSHTVSNRIVLALDLKDNQGVDIIVPLELEAVKGREKTHIITSIYGRGYGSGRTRSTDHVWYINNVMGGSTLYVNKRKAKNFYQSARLQLPMEGKRSFDLFGSSIKTEEDLVKFKLQKEEEYKAAAAREAANEKDSSLQTQPVDKSHLQLRGTASYEPMVTDSIKAVNKEEAKMTAGNQVAASYSC